MKIRDIVNCSNHSIFKHVVRKDTLFYSRFKNKNFKNFKCMHECWASSIGELSLMNISLLHVFGRKALFNIPKYNWSWSAFQTDYLDYLSIISFYLVLKRLRGNIWQVCDLWHDLFCGSLPTGSGIRGHWHWRGGEGVWGFPWRGWACITACSFTKQLAVAVWAAKGTYPWALGYMSCFYHS